MEYDDWNSQSHKEAFEYSMSQIAMIREDDVMARSYVSEDRYK